MTDVKSTAKNYAKLGPRGIDERYWEFNSPEQRTIYKLLKEDHPNAEITVDFVDAIIEKLEEKGIWPTTLDTVIDDFHDMIVEEIDSLDANSDLEDEDQEPPSKAMNEFNDIYKYYKILTKGRSSEQTLYPLYKILYVLTDLELWPLNLTGILRLKEDELSEIISELAEGK